jgi:transposase InsO family protein
MVSKRRRFTREFKIETARLLTASDQSVAGVAEDLEIHPNTLYKWIRQYGENPEEAFPGKGRQTSEAEELSRFMQQHETEFPIGVMCDVFAVSRSGYYAWRKKPVSKRKQANDKLLKEIRIAHHESRETYGSPRVYQALKQKDIPCSENRIARLMQEDGLRAKSKRRFKATTNSKHDLPVAPNLLQRDFSPEKPDQVWAGDITYIWTAAGWLYLVVVLDLFSRSVVGWAMDKRMTRHLVMDALTMAKQRRRPSPGLIFHSDRGSQYASADFQSLLAKHRMLCSMSRKGDCWDNAPTESFFGSLKQELVFHQKYSTRFHARQSIFEYIERFYNRRRLHSTLGFQSPALYETAYFKLAA